MSSQYELLSLLDNTNIITLLYYHIYMNIDINNLI